MPDNSGNMESKSFSVDVPATTEGYFLKGSNAYDWGMKDRLSRIFNPKSGRTVMLAFDHGYIMGPTSGLERMDLSIPPLAPYADVLMCTRGGLRTCIEPTFNKAVCLRCTAGASVLRELSDEEVGVAVDDVIRLNASAMASQVHIGAEFETKSVKNLNKIVNAGMKYGIPTLGVTAVGKDLGRDARYLGLATRMIAEFGAQFVKTYYCAEGFERVVAGCPVPIVIAGGKKLPEMDAMTMCFNAIDQGASGVDMGRNIFQADNPVAMLKAIRAIVHDGAAAKEAFEMYNVLKREE